MTYEQLINLKAAIESLDKVQKIDDARYDNLIERFNYNFAQLETIKEGDFKELEQKLVLIKFASDNLIEALQYHSCALFYQPDN